MKNIVCMKWGTKYPSDYVNRLARMVARHLTPPYRFICLTDDASGLEAGIETRPLPQVPVPAKYDVSPWRKLGMFAAPLYDIQGKVLFLDLDVIVLGPLDDFFTYSSTFSIIENWTQKGQGVGNSSVYCFEAGAYGHVMDYYQDHMEEVLHTYDNEQIYLSKKIGDIAYWPDTWCRSFKFHCVPKGPLKYMKAPQVPPETRIVVFHGDPNPPEAAQGGFYGKFYKYSRPAPWISQHWG